MIEQYVLLCVAFCTCSIVILLCINDICLTLCVFSRLLAWYACKRLKSVSLQA